MNRRPEVIAYLSLWIVVALLATAGVVSAAHHSSGYVTATEAPAAEVCFPAKLWSGHGSTAAPEDRPCDVIGRPEEDGSGTLLLGTLGADEAVCTIPNPREERGHFAVKCHRLPRR